MLGRIFSMSIKRRSRCLERKRIGRDSNEFRPILNRWSEGMSSENRLRIYTIILLTRLPPHPDRSERAHLAERSRLVAARDGAAVIIGQGDDRASVEAGLEHPLATDVEVVAIDEREHGSEGAT